MNAYKDCDIDYKLKCTNNIQNNEFGKFQDIYNWIECDSTHYPRKKYYFNLRTLRSMWIRLVKNVWLPHFYKKSINIF